MIQSFYSYVFTQKKGKYVIVKPCTQMFLASLLYKLKIINSLNVYQEVNGYTNCNNTIEYNRVLVNEKEQFIDTYYSHENKTHLLLGRKVMTSLDSILKGRDITLLTKVHLVKAVVFPVVMYRCESWIIKKAECQRIDAFEL